MVKNNIQDLLIPVAVVGAVIYLAPSLKKIIEGTGQGISTASQGLGSGIGQAGQGLGSGIGAVGDSVKTISDSTSNLFKNILDIPSAILEKTENVIKNIGTPKEIKTLPTSNIDTITIKKNSVEVSKSNNELNKILGIGEPSPYISTNKIPTAQEKQAIALQVALNLQQGAQNYSTSVQNINKSSINKSSNEVRNPNKKLPSATKKK